MATHLEWIGPGGFDGAFGVVIFANGRSILPVDPASPAVRRLLLLAPDVIRLVDLAEPVAAGGGSGPAKAADDGGAGVPSSPLPVVRPVPKGVKRRR